MNVIPRNIQVLGIDAGGTMTDTFFVDADGEFVVGKAQSTPQDKSVGLLASSIDGLANWGTTLEATLPQLQTGVYSGTAMLNRVVQRKGLRCGLIVNRGMERQPSHGPRGAVAPGPRVRGQDPPQHA